MLRRLVILTLATLLVGCVDTATKTKSEAGRDSIPDNSRNVGRVGDVASPKAPVASPVTKAHQTTGGFSLVNIQSAGGGLAGWGAAALMAAGAWILWRRNRYLHRCLERMIDEVEHSGDKGIKERVCRAYANETRFGLLVAKRNRKRKGLLS
ncbi:MAG: hypothetical protein ABFE01_04200 [Phycisphaerales bacterium]